ncbi:MAG: hypothetical protein LWW93_14415 [Hyphomicrobiales bacterium]|nr:hypothetical protein [Hyphomicrobiales bacterium]
MVLPVIARASHWEDEFGATQAVPKTLRRPALRPIEKWSPRNEGFHQASVQLKTPIIDFLNALPPRPDPGPGPAMTPTPAGFAIVGKTPSEAERDDPALCGHHDDVLDALGELADVLDRLRNADPKLVRAVETYAEVVRRPFAEVPLDRLWSLGARVCERIETVSREEMLEVLDERRLRDVTGELNRLHRAHVALIMGTREGRDLTARVAAHRSATRPAAEAERSAAAMLEPMTRQKGLLEPETRAFVGKVAEPLVEGTERIDEIEAGLRTAIHAVTAFFGVLDPLVRAQPTGRRDEATVRERFAGDANLETILAAFDYLSRHDRVIAEFAEATPELRRYVERMTQALTGVEPKALRDPGEPPAGFDIQIVKEMILRGEAPPASWAPWVRELNFAFKSEFVDLSPLRPLFALRKLDLWGTGVSDLSPVSGATGLRHLEVAGTGVVDLSPASSATWLEYLDASRTSVVDLSLLSGATRLKKLILSGTGVSDLSPVSGATGLQLLNVSGTGVSDLSPVSGATGLQSLFLSATGVSDLSPVSGATGLQSLFLSDTGVSDLSPLSRATGLQSLDVSGTGVSDLSPVSKATGLQLLNVSDTGVSDLSPVSKATGLQSLNVSGTGVVDLSPLSGATELADLDISRTSVADLSPVSGAMGLTHLAISGTDVTDLSVLESFEFLGSLDASNLRHVERWPTAWPTSLMQLNLRGSDWPADAPLPAVAWLIAPDSTIRRGEGDDPWPFMFWVSKIEPPRETSPAAEG